MNSCTGTSVPDSEVPRETAGQGVFFRFLLALIVAIPPGEGATELIVSESEVQSLIYIFTGIQGKSQFYRPPESGPGLQPPVTLNPSDLSFK
jgi:hypothetical protein